jgi:hypothetical protein
MDLSYLTFNQLELGQQVDEWERSYIHHHLLEKIEKRISKVLKVHEPMEESLEETINLDVTNTNLDFNICKKLLENKEIDQEGLVNIYNHAYNEFIG